MSEPTELDKEIARWQQAIYKLCCASVGKDNEGLIDGKGIDTGDPLDFTLDEISQALGYWQNELYTSNEAIGYVRKYLAEVGIESAFVCDCAKLAAAEIKKLRNQLDGIREKASVVMDAKTCNSKSFQKGGAYDTLLGIYRMAKTD